MNLHPVVLDALHVDHGHGQAGLPAGDGAGEDEGVGVTELLPLLAEQGKHLWVAHAEQAGDEEAWKTYQLAKYFNQIKSTSSRICLLKEKCEGELNFNSRIKS